VSDGREAVMLWPAGTLGPAQGTVRDPRFHPATRRRPLMSADQLEALADSIATWGVLVPITLDDDGLVVDGRNRLLAAEMAQIEPEDIPQAVYRGRSDAPDGYGLEDFIEAMNDRRRHGPPGG
jgi:hypothetical protein